MSETESTQSIRLPDPSKLIVSNSPHMRSGESISRVMFLVVAAMAPACIAPMLFFGFAATRQVKRSAGQTTAILTTLIAAVAAVFAGIIHGD